MSIAERVEVLYRQTVEGHRNILLQGSEVTAIRDEFVRLMEVESQHAILKTRYNELQDREQWLRQALRFYADHRSYERRLDENGDPSRPEILFDNGNQARVALAETEGPRVY